MCRIYQKGHIVSLQHLCETRQYITQSLKMQQVKLGKKNILIPNFAEKNILILVEEKKKSDSEFLSYNLMLTTGKKIHAQRDK